MVTQCFSSSGLLESAVSVVVPSHYRHISRSWGTLTKLSGLSHTPDQWNQNLGVGASAIFKDPLRSRSSHLE